MSYGADNDILWEYMDRLRWRLRRLPEEQTADILREIRQHMQDLVAGYEAEGRSPAESVRLAEEKFGSAETVGNRILWQRSLSGVHSFICLLLSLLILSLSPAHSILDRNQIALAAAAGIPLGLSFAFQNEYNALHASTRRGKVWGKIISGFFIAQMIAVFWTMPRADIEDLLIISGVMFGAASMSSFVVKAFRKYRRRASL